MANVATTEKVVNFEGSEDISNLTYNPKKGNKITTARYTALNFVPLFLFEQFHPVKKFANFYFLIVCVLQSIKSISVTQGRPTTVSK